MLTHCSHLRDNKQFIPTNFFSFALDDSVFKNEMNDPNLNPGFDLEAFRTGQLDLHNHYRLLHGAPLMTRNERYVVIIFAQYIIHLSC